jgi:hypothetical protein
MAWGNGPISLTQAEYKVAGADKGHGRARGQVAAKVVGRKWHEYRMSLKHEAFVDRLAKVA